MRSIGSLVDRRNWTRLAEPNRPELAAKHIACLLGLATVIALHSACAQDSQLYCDLETECLAGHAYCDIQGICPASEGHANTCVPEACWDIDAGVAPLDAGDGDGFDAAYADASVDGGPTDASVADASVPDASVPDAIPPDAAPPPGGTFLWAKGFGSIGSDRTYAVSPTPDGNILITGDFSSAVSFGGDPLISTTQSNPYVALLSGDDGGHVWSTSFGGAAVGASVVMDDDGDVIVVGSYSQSLTIGGTVHVSSGSADVFVAKLSGADGSPIWSHSFGGTASDYPVDVEVDSNEYIFVTGGFSDTMSFDQTNSVTSNGGDDIFLVKLYGPDGAHVWSTSMGGDDYEQPIDMALDGAGNLLMTGWFRSATMDVEGTALTNLGSRDIFVTKRANSGNHLWSKAFGSTNVNGADEPGGIAVDSNDDIMLTGHFVDPIDFGAGELSANGRDVFVLKLDGGNGSHFWSRAFGGISSESANGIAVDSNDNVIVTGSFGFTTYFGSTSDFLVSNGFGDTFVLKLQADSEVLWYRGIGGLDSEEAKGGVAVGLDDRIFAAGNFRSDAITLDDTDLMGNGENDIYVVALQP